MVSADEERLGFIELVPDIFGPLAATPPLRPPPLSTQQSHVAFALDASRMSSLLWASMYASAGPQRVAAHGMRSIRRPWIRYERTGQPRVRQAGWNPATRRAVDPGVRPTTLVIDESWLLAAVRLLASFALGFLLGFGGIWLLAST